MSIDLLRFLSPRLLSSRDAQMILDFRTCTAGSTVIMRNAADFLNNADYLFTDRLMVRPPIRVTRYPISISRMTASILSSPISLAHVISICHIDITYRYPHHILSLCPRYHPLPLDHPISTVT